MNSPSAIPAILPLSSSFLTQIDPPLSYAWAGLLVVIGIVLYASSRSEDPYDAIPAVGRTGFISSYIDAIRFLTQTKTLLQEGYDKYKPGIYRVPELNRWHIMVTGDKLIDELRKAPDDILSLDEAGSDILAADYTVGSGVTGDMYHVGVIRSQFSRNLASLFHDIRDELVLAFEDYIPVTEDWSSVRALEKTMSIVSRTSNRIFVGAPTCRDLEYIKLNIQFTIDVVIGAKIINLFPNILKPIVGRFCTNVPKAIRTGLKHLEPLIEERQRKIDEYGLNYPDKPNDLLSWLMDEAKGDQRSTHKLTLRVLALNFAAIHTTSMSFAHALLHLAARPEYIQPIREEIEAIIAEHGWSKVALTRMRKLDSFLKESLRTDGFTGITLTRKVMKDYTFSNGTFVPKGAFVSAVAVSRHLDNDIYPNATTFDGFRFSNIREEGGEGTKNQMVATSGDYLPFGHGKHACPGRFLAANQLKSMMAHVVLTYDIKMENEGVRPESLWHAFACIPDPKAEVLFRRRRK